MKKNGTIYFYTIMQGLMLFCAGWLLSAAGWTFTVEVWLLLLTALVCGGIRDVISEIQKLGDRP